MLTNKQISDIQNLLEQKPIPMPVLGKTLQESLGILWQDHRDSAAQKLGAWLKANVPGVQMEDNYAWCGAARPAPKPEPVPVPVPEKQEADPAKLAQLFLANLDSNGALKLTKAQQLMNNNGFGPWRETLKEGESYAKMYNWAEDKFAAWFTVYNEGLDWYLQLKEEGSAPNPGDEQSLGGYPLDLDPASPDSLNEVKAMHGFAFMGPWNSLAKNLYRITGLGGTKDEYWRAIIAHKMNRAFALMGDHYLTGTGAEGESRVALKLDLNSAEGRPLYMVFCENEQKADKPGVQPWRLMDCCYPGQAGVGTWLCTAFGLKSEEQSVTLERHSRLSDLLNEAKSVQPQVMEALGALAAAVAQNRRPGAEELQTLAGYNSLWDQIAAVMAELGEPAPAELTLDQVWDSFFSRSAQDSSLVAGCAILAEVIGQVQTQLVELHYMAEENNACAADLKVLEENVTLLQLGTGFDSAPLLELLELYGGLCRLSEVELLSESDDALLDKLSEHLAVSFVRLNKVFVGGEELTRYQDDLRGLEEDLRRRTASQQPAPAPAQQAVSMEMVSPDQLSELVGRVFGETPPDRPEIYSSFAAPNRLELLFISCDFEEARQLAQDAAAMEAMGYSERRTAQIQRRLEYTENLSHAGLPLACGDRLFYLEGNDNRQAEKFWLAAIPNDTALANLIALYRREERQADFLCLMGNRPTGMALAPEEYNYLFKCFADQGDYQKILDLAQEQPYLMYQSAGGESNRELVLYAARQCGNQEMVDRCALVESRMGPAAQPDLLEEAVIACDTAQLESLLAAPEELQEQGYDPERLEQLRAGLNGGEYPTGDDAFETGLRLWQLLGTSHGLAERFMWNGMAPVRLGYQLNTGLFPLLAAQQRWDEVALLYRAYPAALGTQPNCRRIYLLALCRLEPDKAAAYAREHLADALDSRVRPILTAALEGRADRLLEMLAELETVSAASEFARCVILADPGIRDFILHPEQLAELNLGEEELERITACYKNDSYPHQQDPASVGLRFYTFLRERFGLAEKLARLGLPGKNAALLLCHILEQGRRWEEISQLFGQLPDLPAWRPSAYLRHVVRSGLYAEYLALDEKVKAGLDPEERASFENMARLNAQAQTEEECLPLLSFAPAYVEANPDRFVELSAALAAKGFKQAWGALVGGVFAHALAAYPDESLEAFAAAGGAVTEEELLAWQQTWLAEEASCPAALWLWRFKGLGDLAEKAEEYYQSSYHSTLELPAAEKHRVLNLLSRLYPEQKSSIEGQHLLYGLEAALEAAAPGEKAAAVLARLEGAALTEDAAAPVLELLEKENLLGEEEVLAALAGAAPAAARGLLARRAAAAWPAEGARPAPAALCGLFVQLLEEGALEQDVAEKAVTICERSMMAKKTPAAAYALWKLYKACFAGQPVYPALAGAALVYLLGLPREEMPAEMAAGLKTYMDETPLEEMAEGGADLLGVFRALLGVISADDVLEEVQKFQARARLFVVPRPADRQTVNQYAAAQQSGCSPEEAESILRLFLYSPRDKEPWLALRALPVGDDPKTALQMMQLYAAARDDDQVWAQLVDQMLEQGGENALSGALRLVSRRLETGKNEISLVGAQQQALSLAGLLAKAEEQPPREELERLADALCATLEAPLDRHKTLANLAVFGAETGCEEYILKQEAAWNAYFSQDGLAAAGVFACRLLLKGSLASARLLLERLASVMGPLVFRPLYKRLAELDAAALESWVARPAHRRVLALALPDGQRPSYEKSILPQLVMPCLPSDDADLHRECAEAIQLLMEIFPEDGCLGLALYLVCKRDVAFEGRLLCLYRALLFMSTGRKGVFTARSRARLRDDLVLLGCLLNKKDMGEQAFGGRPGQANYQKLLNIYSEGDAQALLRSETHWNAVLEKGNTALAGQLVLARITGEWTSFVTKLFNTDSRLAAYIDWLGEETTVEAPGLLRSLLKLYITLPESRRGEFITWMSGNRGALGNRPRLAEVFRHAHLFITDFYRDASLADDADLLELPLEESSTNRMLYQHIGAREEERDFRRVLLLTVCLRDNGSLMYLADEAFKKQEDAAAAVYYHALDCASRTNNGFDIELPYLPPPPTYKGVIIPPEQQRRFTAVQVSARRTLCGCLAGFSQPVRFMQNSQAPRARCMAANALIQLVEADRAAQLPRLLAAYPADIRRFLLHIYRLIRDCVPDDTPASKLKWALQCPSREERYLALRLLARLVPRYQPESVTINTEMARNNGPFGTLHCPNARLGEKAIPFAQLEEGLKTLLAQTGPAPVLQQEEDGKLREPAFVARLQKEFGPDEEVLPLVQLLEAHDAAAEKLRTPMLPEEERRELLAAQRLCSLRRYRRESAGGKDFPHLACLALGVDEWNWQWEQVRAGADRALMDEAFLELAPVAAACPAQSPEYEEYAQLATSALFGILHAVPSLEELVHLHQKHRRAFGLLRQIIERRSPADGQNLKRMLDQLAGICQTYQNSTASEEMRLATLDDLQKQFDAGEYTEDRTWRPVRVHLQGLVTAAVARMRDLPRLSIQVYNKEITRYDSLFGEVMNSGSQAAQDITLHATSADGSLGVEYKLNRLRAGSRAPFRVSFNLPPEVAELNYTLTLTYSFGGQSFTTRPVTDRMAVAEKLPAKLPAAPYPTESIKDYTLSADGKVTSLQLFGREYEKSHLEELVSGPFSNYRDAFVRGFRRAGKTSLLNYLGSYVEFTCQEENVVPLYVSVQDCTDSRIIYDAFINRVMIAAGKVLPAVANPGNAKWEQLRRRWDRGAEDPDYQLSDLNVFFVELSEALAGRKIVLMMDELDTLIKHFEQNENVHNRLLAGLDALLDDMYIHRYVRFILCGSNNLIRYQMDGGILHQAFQRIGTLEVGNLSYTDIKAMLTAPEKDPRYTLKYTEAALEYIFRFTGGAVWYTRLLGTALVEQLSREGRSVVYPSDVCSCYANVLDDKNCDQFYEACGSLEKAVINSLQRYTGHLESSATLDEIRVGLESIDPASIQRALQLLQQLGLVRQSRDSGGVRYSFTTEMYRQFFRSKGSTPDSVPSDDGQFLAPAQEKQSSSSMLEDLMADLL